MRTDNNKNKKDFGIKRLIIVSICCVLVTVAAGLCVLWYYFAPKRTDAVTLTVPDYLGAEVDQVKAPRGFLIEKVYEYSDDADSGIVMAQKPLANSRRKSADGERIVITLTVSLGRKTNLVPDIGGMPYIPAALKLREIGADVVSIAVYDTGEEHGSVLYSDPPTGSEITDGERVVIYVAKKRTAASVKVPELVGMDVDEACLYLMLQGLTLGEVECFDHDPTRTDKVTRQSIMQGVYVKYGTKIDLAVGSDELDGTDNTEESDEETTRQAPPSSPWWQFWHRE